MRFTTGDEVTCSEEHSILDVYEFKETYVLITEGGGREGGGGRGDMPQGTRSCWETQAHTLTAHLVDTTLWW